MTHEDYRAAIYVMAAVGVVILCILVGVAMLLPWQVAVPVDSMLVASLAFCVHKMDAGVLGR